MIEEIISGTPIPVEERTAIVDRLKTAYDEFTAEGQHFVHWRKR